MNVLKKSCWIICLLLSWNIRAQSPDRPNIVLIVGDDHDLSAVGCYGNPQIKPRIWTIWQRRECDLPALMPPRRAVARVAQFAFGTA